MEKGRLIKYNRCQINYKWRPEKKTGKQKHKPYGKIQTCHYHAIKRDTSKAYI